ncbi:HTH-type transcriptional regulator HdfR [Castellaniella defragrans]
MIHLNPTHLRSFLAVANAGSITQAARCVSRVPSAVTHAIQDLESSLDVSLFERHPHGMRLTEFGTLLRHRAELAFQEMEKARQALDELPQAPPYKRHAPVFTLGIARQRLLVFVALTEQCHMGTVARSFGISQAAVSLALKDIEQSLGLTLLTRTPTNLVPNAAGGLLALAVQRALGELSKAEEEIATRLRGITGHVAVGTLSLGRGWLLPQAILHVSTQHPDIRISTVEGSFEHLAAMLHATQIDFILGGIRPQEQMPGLVSRSVLLSGIVFLGRRGHPGVQAADIDGWPFLTGARWILPGHGTWTRSAVETALAEHGLPPPYVAIETADVTITRALLLTSDFISAASPHLFQNEIDSGDLAVFPLAPRTAAREIGMVMRANSQPTIASRLLMSAITDLAGGGIGTPHAAPQQAAAPADPNARHS